MKLFICHASEDKTNPLFVEFWEQLCLRFAAPKGHVPRVNIFIDDSSKIASDTPPPLNCDSIPIGAKWYDEIEKRLAEGDLWILAVLTRPFAAKLKFAMERQKAAGEDNPPSPLEPGQILAKEVEAGVAAGKLLVVVFDQSLGDADIPDFPGLRDFMWSTRIVSKGESGLSKARLSELFQRIDAYASEGQLVRQPGSNRGSLIRDTDIYRANRSQQCAAFEEAAGATLRGGRLSPLVVIGPRNELTGPFFKRALSQCAFIWGNATVADCVIEWPKAMHGGLTFETAYWREVAKRVAGLGPEATMDALCRWLAADPEPKCVRSKAIVPDEAALIQKQVLAWLDFWKRVAEASPKGAVRHFPVLLLELANAQRPWTGMPPSPPGQTPSYSRFVSHIMKSASASRSEKYGVIVAPILEPLDEQEVSDWFETMSANVYVHRANELQDAMRVVVDTHFQPKRSIFRIFAHAKPRLSMAKFKQAVEDATRHIV